MIVSVRATTHLRAAARNGSPGRTRARARYFKRRPLSARKKGRVTPLPTYRIIVPMLHSRLHWEIRNVHHEPIPRTRAAIM